MHTVSPSLQARFIAHPTERMFPGNLHPFCVKWLRYTLDFREKYHCPHEPSQWNGRSRLQPGTRHSTVLLFFHRYVLKKESGRNERAS